MGLKPRQPLVGLAFCAVAGIVAADLLISEAPLLWPWAAAASAILAATGGWRYRRDKTAARLLLGLAAMAFFFFWHSRRQAESPGHGLAAQIPASGCVVRATGIVDEEPAPQARFRLRLESIAIGEKTGRTSATVLLQWPASLPASGFSKATAPTHPGPQYGDRVEIIGSAYNLTATRNPGEFDTLALRRRQGIDSQIVVRYPQDARIVSHGHGQPVRALAFRLRHWMERTMALDIGDSPELVALIQSMVLGSRGDSLAETQRLFQYTGTLHLFAVSGMNVAMLAAMAAWLLRALRMGRRGIALVVIPLLWVYCFVTGLGASSVRATVMASLAFAGIAIDRPALAWNTLGASALAIFLWDPNQLFTPGFQLSFLLVLVLLGAARPVQAFFEKFGRPDPFLPRVLWPRGLVARAWATRELAGHLGISLVAWAGSMPLMVFYFHLWSPSTVPANLVAVLLAWVMLLLGLGSVLAGTCSLWLAATFNNANWLFAKGLLLSISALAAIPGSHLFVATPSLHRAPVCEVEILDLGSGAAIHLRTHTAAKHWFGPGEARDWLVDCGSATAFARIVTPYLQSRGVNRLEGLILTHGDSHHIGGAPGLLASRTLAPAEVIDSPLRDRSAYRRAVHTTLAAQNTGAAIVWRGDVLTLAPGITLHVLFPPEGLQARAADDKTLVIRLDVSTPGHPEHTTRILFTSDAGFLTEHWLLEHAPAEELRSDILVKGMHASDLSGTPEFLDAVRPALVVTSGADFPPAEQVKAEWAATVATRGISLLRQDKAGAVRIAIDGQGGWRAEPYLGASVFRSSSR